MIKQTDKIILQNVTYLILFEMNMNKLRILRKKSTSHFFSYLFILVVYCIVMLRKKKYNPKNCRIYLIFTRF